MKISLHEPIFKKNEFKEIKKCFSSGWLSAGGSYVLKLEKKISKLNAIKYCSCVTNGTAALQVALRSLNIFPGEEVLVSTITFISTINSIIYNNASPIFFDVDKNFNIDQEKVLSFLKEETFLKKKKTYNKKTKKIIRAIIIVHVFGIPANFEKIYEVCKKKNITIIEDAAESLGSKYIKGKFKNKYTGTVGDLGCYSFNGNKIISSGGGGAIVTNKFKLKKKIDYLITQAKDNNVDFIHNTVGYNFKMTNLHAAVGFANLKKLKKFIIAKKKIYKYYLDNIKNGKVNQPNNQVSSNYWLNVVTLKNYTKKKEILNNLLKKNIEARSIWYPNHLQLPFLKFQKYKIINAPKLIKKSICLPSSPHLTKNELNKIIRVIND
jgi:perosamine synthetase